MGEAADLILDGTLCEECGVTIDCTSPGHPRLCVACSHTQAGVDADAQDGLNETAKLELYFDGSCEPRSPGGVATCGWILKHNGTKIASDYREVCRGAKATNNVAEWSACGFGLRYILDHKESIGHICTLVIRGDSQLVINQLNDSLACNKEHLIRLRDRCRELLKLIGCEWKALWINRDLNSAADALSRQAYEEATGKPFPERRRKAKR